ncbi:helix-turn-helix transcriptional regulator [Vibrio harveyi]|nr:helix-turn-helix transcriptional regulator [Vibrio harveyi]
MKHDTPDIVNRSKLIVNNSFFFFETENITYFSGVTGWLEEKFVVDNLQCPITIVKSKKNIVIRSRNEQVITTKNTKLLVINSGYDIKLDDNCIVVVIKKAFYSGLGLPSFPFGIINHVHELIIDSLIDSIQRSGRPEYELIALANLIGVDNYQHNVNCKYRKLVKCIEKNFSEDTFNLDKLCTLTHMSRRKAQYIFSENGTSFLEVLHSYRTKELKNLIIKNPSESTTTLIYKVGFKNQMSANRAFLKCYNETIKEYKRTCIQRLNSTVSLA